MSSAGAPSPGGSLRIDLERAPQAITELEAARDELIAIRNEALKLGKVDPGSADSVSVDAAARLSAAAVEGPSSLAGALAAGIDRLDDLIRLMNSDLRDHREVEDQGVASFRH